MKCELCGREFALSCRACTKRVMTWGVDGTLALYEMAKRRDDILAQELLEFANKYYVGRGSDQKINTLKIALKIIGYKGKFIGRIHKNIQTYLAQRRRENETARRWRLKEDYCEKCGITEALQVHHIVPLSWGGVSSEENCITLCKKCHQEAHKKLGVYLNRMKLLQYLEPHKDEIYSLAQLSI